MTLHTKGAVIASVLLGVVALAFGQDTKPAAPDEKPIREVAARFAEAFNKRDAAALAALFAADARVIDPDGAAIEGRDAIRDRFVIALEANPDLKVDFTADNIRFLTPDVAVEEGHAVAKSSSGETFTGLHTVVYVKRGGAWEIMLVRDQEGSDPESDTPHAHLQELAWMVGDWVDEGDDSVVRTSCAWSEDGNYLVRSFTEHVRGEKASSGTQRIGWDPQREQIRSWVFDADGGFSEGLWTRAAENRWVIKATGTTADGDTATATNVIIREHPDTMTWQSVDRTLAGVALPDIEQIIIARKPPAPGGTNQAAPATPKSRTN